MKYCRLHHDDIFYCRKLNSLGVHVQNNLLECYRMNSYFLALNPRLEYTLCIIAWAALQMGAIQQVSLISKSAVKRFARQRPSIGGRRRNTESAHSTGRAGAQSSWDSLLRFTTAATACARSDGEPRLNSGGSGPITCSNKC